MTYRLSEDEVLVTWDAGEPDDTFRARLRLDRETDVPASNGGWLIPYFDRAEADRLVRRQDEMNADIDVPPVVDTFRWYGDRLLQRVYYSTRDWPDEYPEDLSRDDDDFYAVESQDGRWAIGEGWTWCLAPQAHVVTLRVTALVDGTRQDVVDGLQARLDEFFPTGNYPVTPKVEVLDDTDDDRVEAAIRLLESIDRSRFDENLITLVIDTLTEQKIYAQFRSEGGEVDAQTLADAGVTTFSPVEYLDDIEVRVLNASERVDRFDDGVRPQD